MKVENIKEQYQFSLDNNFDGYLLKTDEEILNIISDFGCGGIEFHTADIDRIIMEKQALYNLLLSVKHRGYLINSDNINKALEYYKP